MGEAGNVVRDRHWLCAQRLRDRRLTLGLTQREVVARLQRHGHRTTNRALSAMENGRGLDVGLLPDLADALGCTVTYLLGLTSDPSAWQPASGWAAPAAQPGSGGDHAASPSVPVTGILGPHLPGDFSAPARARQRAGGNAKGGRSDPRQQAHHQEVSS